MTVLKYWHEAKGDHPELTREHCILIGSFVAGMSEGYLKERRRGREFTQEEINLAVDIAANYFKGFGYVLPKKRVEIDG